jgi:hypothetical protein
VQLSSIIKFDLDATIACYKKLMKKKKNQKIDKVVGEVKI